jgi:hypothetical protein
MSFLIHPDDMPSPRFGGWADDFNTFEEACHYYGCDTPAQIADEQAYYEMLENIEAQDEIEARGGPVVGHWRSNYEDRRLAAAYSAPGYWDDCPF